MRGLISWLRSLVPTAFAVAKVAWIILVIVGLVRWLNGSFAEFDSLKDFAFRASVAVLLPIVAGILCAMIENLGGRFRLRG